MDKNQIIDETRRIIENYSVTECNHTADALEALWLTGDTTKSYQLVKKEQREKLDFKGIKLDVLKLIGREAGKNAENADDFIPLAELLWNEYGREGRIVSVMILGQIVVLSPEKVVQLCRKLVKTSVSWEDCDNMVEGVEPLIRKEPEYLEWLNPWLEDPNKWVKRCALTVVGRLPMKNPEYTEKCLEMVVPCLSDSDLDIKRAVSFAVRMGARGDTRAVLNFVKQYAGGGNPDKIWVFSDVIRSMTRKFLPEFEGLLPVYEEWLGTVDDPKSKKSLESAIKILR